jgi:hypothetical protein
LNLSIKYCPVVVETVAAWVRLLQGIECSVVTSFAREWGSCKQLKFEKQRDLTFSQFLARSVILFHLITQWGLGSGFVGSGFLSWRLESLYNWSTRQVVSFVNFIHIL